MVLTSVYNSRISVPSAQRSNMDDATALEPPAFVNENAMAMKQSYYNETLPEQLSRVFPIWNRSSRPYNWCHRRETTNNTGLLFVKVPKCASTTGMGATIRIADTVGRRLLSTPCFTRYRHGTAMTGDRNYLHRTAERSFLWSLIRHPSERVLSAHFFFTNSRRGRTATEESILNYAKSPRFRDLMANYLRLQRLSSSKTREIQHTLQNYDFLGISERMEESLVVLAMLTRVPLADVVVLPSKVSGGYDDGKSPRGCVLIHHKWSTPTVDGYLYGEFLDGNADYLLYQAVNISLDRTIDTLGRSKVQKGVRRYRKHLAKNERECRDRAILPCPITRPNQTLLSEQDCYFSDAGCGHRCTDQVLRDESEEEWEQLQLQM